MDRLSVDLPARSDSIPVVRSLVAGVAALAGMSIAEVEHLRLACSEACTYLLKVAPGATTLRATMSCSPGRVRIVTALDDPDQRAGWREMDQFMPWFLLGELTDGARLDWTSDGPSILFERTHTP